jgi:hypothetical protein
MDDVSTLLFPEQVIVGSANTDIKAKRAGTSSWITNM